MKIYLILFILLASQLAYSQSDSILIGRVSFKTSEHIYVRFPSTDNIHIGDTLLTFGKVCLLVKQKSSTSCVCARLNQCVVSENDEVSFMFQSEENNHLLEESEVFDTSSPLIEDVLISKDSLIDVELEPLFIERIRGRLSASTYSSLAPDDKDNRHRLMLRGSVNAYHINNSRFSFESYVNYRHNILQSNPENNQTEFLRLYNLALTYDINESTRFALGRKINRKLSSVGAIDGIQLEREQGNFYVGIIAGFRPDIREFSFNSNLFQYGGYLGIQSDKNSNTTQTTLGFLEQHNRGLDRRYVYIQHRSSLGRKLSFFGSMEMDIYGKVDSIKSGDPRLTSLYLSTRYRFSRKATVSISYDTRKRIIYYETLRSDIERLLADDEARQGLRLTLNLRPLKYVNCGISTSHRFQQSEANKSSNINGYVTHSKIPGIKGSLSAHANFNSSNYLESQIISFRYARQLFKNKLSSQVYFRNVNYIYKNTELRTTQQYYGLNLTFRISRSVSLSLLTEMANRKADNHYRFNTKLIKRFNKNKKK